MNISKQTVIAIAGVSTNEKKYGHKIFVDLLENGYCVFGINPKSGIVHKQKLYSSLEELPQKPELLILVVPPKIGLAIIHEAQKMGITNFWLQPGAESEEILQYCQENKLEVIHNSCFMVQQNIW